MNVKEPRPVRLVLIVFVLMITTLLKSVPLIKTGDVEAFWIYIIGNWIISAGVIFMINFGVSRKFRLVLFAFASLPVLLFGTIYIVSDYMSPGQRLLRAAASQRNKKVEKLLSQKELGEWYLEEAAAAAVDNENIELLRLLINADIFPKDEESLNPLMSRAVYGSHIACAEILLEMGATVKPIHYAAQNSHLEMLDFLLESGADINSQDEDGRTVLHCAIDGQDGSLELIQSLLERGADPFIVDQRGFPPAQKAYDDVLEYLTGLGAGNIEVDRNGNTALHHAVDDNDFISVKKNLSEGLFQVNVRNDEGRTPLLIAVEEGYADIAEALLDAGADANVEDRKHMTPLIVAANRKGGYSLCRILLDAGADVNYSGWSMPPLEIVLWNRSSSRVKLFIDRGAEITVRALDNMVAMADPDVSALFRDKLEAEGAWTPELSAFTAVGEDDVESLRKLADEGLKLDEMRSGKTTLAHHAAVHSRDPGIFAILEEQDSYMRTKDIDGHFPLNLAVHNDNTEAFKLFWPPDGISSSQDELDEYLKWAICYGCPDLSSTLIDLGADITHFRKSGTPALHKIPHQIYRAGAELSEEESAPILRKLVRILMEAGADPDWIDNRGWTGYDAHEGCPVIMEAMKALDNSDGV